MTESPNFREFVDYLQSAARFVGEQFKDPEDDWMPVGHVQDSKGRPHIIGFDSRWFESDSNKDRLVHEVIVPHLIKAQAIKFGMIISTWAIQTLEHDESGLRPSAHPDRREQLLLQAFDQERVETWHAQIYRDGEQPPALSEWEGPELDVSGRFVDPIKEALR